MKNFIYIAVVAWASCACSITEKVELDPSPSSINFRSAGDTTSTMPTYLALKLLKKPSTGGSPGWAEIYLGPGMEENSSKAAKEMKTIVSDDYLDGRKFADGLYGGVWVDFEEEEGGWTASISFPDDRAVCLEDIMWLSAPEGSDLYYFLTRALEGGITIVVVDDIPS